MSAAPTDARLNPSLTPHPSRRQKTATLFDLGFSHVGLDDCWQQCEVGGSIARNSSGFAQIDKQKFPDMAAMVRYGQHKGVQMGFYSDNCRCHELNKPTHYQQDAHLTERLGFDAIKIDSWCNSLWGYCFCDTDLSIRSGNQRDMAEWARDFEAEGKEAHQKSI